MHDNSHNSDENVEEQMRLIFMRLRHQNPHEYIDSLIIHAENGLSVVSPRAMNKIGMSFYYGLHGVNKSFTLAQKCFSWALEKGEAIAGLNLAVTYIRQSTPNFDLAIQLFISLLENLNGGNQKIQKRKNEIYFLGGLLFFRTKDYHASRKHFSDVQEGDVHHGFAKRYVAKIDELTGNGFSQKK